MNSKLEQRIEEYKHVDGLQMPKEKRDLWWEIRQMVKDLPKALQMKVYREAHPAKYIEGWHRQRDKNKLLKVEVLTHYGDDSLACVWCGEDRVACLSIDHIEGRGNRQRKGSLRSSSSFYSWLKKQGYPSGYQTLCMNCQFVKRFENKEEGQYAAKPIDFSK